jgi:hypothetical protein
MQVQEGEFDEIEAISDNGLVMVSLEGISEGFAGDYQEDDPEDKPLLRFTIYRKYQEGMDADRINDVCYTGEYEDGDWIDVSQTIFSKMAPLRTRSPSWSAGSAWARIRPLSCSGKPSRPAESTSSSRKPWEGTTTSCRTPRHSPRPFPTR